METAIVLIVIFLKKNVKSSERLRCHDVSISWYVTIYPFDHSYSSFQQPAKWLAIML